MEQKNKNIDDLFREELGGYTEAPPPAAWGALKKRLGSAPVARPPFVVRNMRYIAMAALAVSFTAATVAYTLSHDEQTNQATPATDAANGTQLQDAAPVNDATATTIPEEHTSTPDPGTLTNTTDKDNSKNTATTASQNIADNKVAVDEHTTTVKKNTPTAAPSSDANNQATPANNHKQSATTNNIALKTQANVFNTAPAKAKQAAKLSSNAPAITAKGNNKSASTTIAYNAPMNNPAPTETEQEENSTIPEILKGIVPQAAIPQDATADSTKAPAKKADATPVVQAKKEAPQKKQNKKPRFVRFEAGIKAGYERAFDNNGATKFLASPYVQYKLSPKFAMLLQPAVKTSKVNTRTIGTARSYYRVNNDGVTNLADSTPLYIPNQDTLWLRNYSYSQSHDSVVKTNSFGGRYMEFDMPVLLKYSISDKFSVYGGVNMSYSKLLTVTEHTTTSEPITKTGSAITAGQRDAATPAVPDINSVITYTGTNYTSYTGPQYATPSAGLFRLGYMIGFSYSITDNILFDGLIQQGTAKQNVQGGYNINNSLSAPYFRLTIGYKLTK